MAILHGRAGRLTALNGGVRTPAGVLMAAREPLSPAHLDDLGLLAARDGLPGCVAVST